LALIDAKKQTGVRISELKIVLSKLLLPSSGRRCPFAVRSTGKDLHLRVVGLPATSFRQPAYGVYSQDGAPLE